MTKDYVEEVRRLLASKVKGLSEVNTVECHLATFEALWRDEPVTVEIRDYGPRDPAHRYMCVAKTEDGRVAAGNGAETPEMAIRIAHWDKLAGR